MSIEYFSTLVLRDISTTQFPRVLQQFLFHWFLFRCFCSAFLFCWPFCTYTCGPQHPIPKGPPTTFVPLFLFHIFVLLGPFLHLHLWSPPPHVWGSSNNFCYAHFLFCIFVPLTFLHLLIGSPPPHVWVSSNNFYSAMTFLHCSHIVLFCCFLFCIFVPLTFLHLLLGSLSPHVWVSSNNFYSAMTFLHCSHIVLFYCFCSSDLFALVQLSGRSPSSSNTICNAY